MEAGTKGLSGGEMSSKVLYLVCNAHLDPVWLWEWEEGAAEALSTFREAAALCGEYEEFVFNHNEAVLYKWVEQFEPDLFSTIQELVKDGKWHIMGGWFLQPDCNLPSGESLVRQILVGKQYFKDKFGVEPKTAINFDPFGHSRGLVQILIKSGYSSYLFCRPDSKCLTLPADDFIWVGYEGSEILAHRAPAHYNSEGGKAHKKVESWLAKNAHQDIGLLLWGVGNHGGGASREDLAQLRKLMAENTEREITHGIPEDYFRAISKKRDKLPCHTGDLNPWAVGCYTTMALVKQKHRQLESSYYLTEKMVTHAALQGLMDYPREKLREAVEDLLFCEFHDVLPGSSIPQVESYALQRMDHGLEILSRLRARVFFALLSGEPQAEEGEIPVFVYNPHPYPVEETIVCELQPQELNPEKGFIRVPALTGRNGASIPCQLEKESSNIADDWRKRVVFKTGLNPGQMNRFTCRLTKIERESRKADTGKSPLLLKSDSSEVEISRETGLVERYRIDGVDFLLPDSFRLLVVEDYPDPWGMKVRAFRQVKGHFTLMSKERCARFAGISASELEPVRVIEDGPVRTVVEALFACNNSSACQRYKIPKKGKEFEVEVRVFWDEKDTMLKLSIPTFFRDGRCRGQVAYGVEEFNRFAEELVAQKWVGVVSSDRKYVLTAINSGTHGFDFSDGELRMSLLRSAAYSGYPLEGEVNIVPQDRFETRIDQGERIFRFWIQGGFSKDCLSKVDREALVKNEAPLVLSCFPSGKGEKPASSILVSDESVQVTALKMAEEHNWLIIRLFEPTGEKRKTSVTIPCFHLSFDVLLDGFEVKTMAVDLSSKEVFEVDLMERRM